MVALRKNIRTQRGQGMTEYIIIVALIAIAAIGVVTVFGNNIRALFGAADSALSNKPGNPATADGQKQAKKADLKNFANGQHTQK